MAAAKRRMDLAVALFEKGFSDDRVEGALSVCKTLKEALAWLNERGCKRKQVDRADGKRDSDARGSIAKRPSMASPTKQPRASLGLASSPSQDGVTLRLSHRVETCTICFTEAAPMKAVRLGCRHGWYCFHCMKMHANARLNVGDVCVPCPECRAPIPDFSLKKILSDDVVAHFHTRSIKQAIACSPNLFTCPSANCEFCVELEDGDDSWLRKCPQCRKGSCLRCGAQPYHKGITCQMHALRSRTDKLKGAELSLRRWMRKTGTKQCPQCNMGVTKEDLENQGTQRAECHKMLCRHCGTRFCFKCLAVLSESYTCGCSIDRHGFINPVNGRRIRHLRVSAKSPAATAKAFSCKRPAAAANVSLARSGRGKKSSLKISVRRGGLG